MKISFNDFTNDDDWTLQWEELLYGSAIKFLDSDKKILVVGFNKDNDFRHLFLDEEPDEDFFIKSYEEDGYKAVAIFERNNEKINKKYPRKCLTYIDSYNFMD